MATRIIVYLYTFTLIALALYTLHTIILLLLYLRHRNVPSPQLPRIAPVDLPTVTVQIPMRNEAYVARRILRAAGRLDWPRDRLEIHVLDDSDDETTHLVHAEARKMQAQGIPIEVMHRSHPQGHKAGALKAALPYARGDFVAIFDADFCPPPSFLRDTVPHLVGNSLLGLVQARWEHLNAEYNAITRAQALALDAHFTVEHLARNRSGLLMNFNGTAGVWRRQAIREAGGWQNDTVAEDLDLSYRAQLAGWEILYLPDVVAPAELPPLVSAFKDQQYRWAKGATQTLRKLALPILRSPRLRWHQKIMAILHLSGYFTQPLFLLLFLLTLPVVLCAPHLPPLTAILGTVTALLPLLYLTGQVALRRDWPRRILYYPVLMLLGLGITWSTTIALIDGLCHWGGAFIRTPKFKLWGRQGNWRRTPPRIGINRTISGEIALGLYALLVLGVAHQLQQADMIPVSLIYLSSEVLILWGTLMQRAGYGSRRHK